jgi:outer membrane protein with beta-barrel domain
MKSQAYIIIAVLFLITSASYAQKLSYGFRAGLSYSKFLGPFEVNAAGEALETYSLASGFHIGFAVNYAATDLFGVRGELLFSQRGTSYTYEGDSYYFLRRNVPGEEKHVFGKRKTDMGVSMANLELPIVVYYKIGSFELLAGVNVSVLMTSTGGGSISISEAVSPSGNPVDSFGITLVHNYAKDGARQAGRNDLSVLVDGNTVYTSSTTGAYYDYDVKNKNLYQTFDFGLTAGLSFFLNDGLFIGARVIYGLTDLDRNEYDISYQKLDNNDQYILRADKNTNLTLQASIGFLF